jgi:hypothetical protein
MKIRLDEKMKMFNGEVLMDRDSQGTLSHLTMKMVLMEGLLRSHPSDDRLNGVEKMKRFDLAKRIYDAKDSIDLSAEDIVLAKEAIGVKLPVLVVGLAYKILDEK